MARHCKNLAYYAVFSLPLAWALAQFVSEGLVISKLERLAMELACWIVAAVALAGMVKAWKAAYEKSQSLRSATSLLIGNWVAIFMLAGGIFIATDFLKDDTHIGYLGVLLWFIAVINIIRMFFDKMMPVVKPKHMATFTYPKPRFTTWMGPVCPMCNAPFEKPCIDGQGLPRARHNARK